MTPLMFIGVLQGAFIVGAMFIIVPYYAAQPELRHVAYVTLSYACMTVSTIHSVSLWDTPLWKLRIIS